MKINDPLLAESGQTASRERAIQANTATIMHVDGIGASLVCDAHPAIRSIGRVACLVQLAEQRRVMQAIDGALIGR